MAKAAKVRYRLTVVLAIPGIKPENYESSRGNSGSYRVIRNQVDLDYTGTKNVKISMIMYLK